MNYIVQYAFLLVIMNSALASKCGCRRKPVPEPPVDCPLFQADNQCVAGFHLAVDGNCTEACGAADGGTTYQQYIGIDVVCAAEMTSTEPDLDSCKAFCTPDGLCLSGSFNSETGFCINHVCDPLGENTFNDPDAFIEFIDDAGPCITYFVKNCPIPPA